MKHLLADISGHGFGHLAQTAPVINATASSATSFRLTIRSTLPEELVRQRIQVPFNYINHELDKGMVMHDAVRVNADASFTWYQAHHKNYAALVAKESRYLQSLKPDLVFANVPYLSLEAASLAGIPSLAMCSLNWFDILQRYCSEQKNAGAILEQILSAYNKAQWFLRPEPSIPMQDLSNTKSISPIAEKGNLQRATLLDSLPNSAGNEKFILVSLGGIPTNFSVEHWPKMDDVYWVIPQHISSARTDIIYPESIDLPFIDLMTSVDLIITKTGYGTLVEATTNKTPVICVERGDWPEESEIFPWCKEQAYIQIISFDDLISGDIREVVETMLNVVWEKPTVKADGANEAATIINQALLNS